MKKQRKRIKVAMVIILAVALLCSIKPFYISFHAVSGELFLTDKLNGYNICYRIELSDEDLRIVNEVLNHKIYTSLVAAYLSTDKHNWGFTRSEEAIRIETTSGNVFIFDISFFTGLKVKIDTLNVYRSFNKKDEDAIRSLILKYNVSMTD